MKYLFTIMLALTGSLCLSQNYQEGKAAYDAKEYEKAFDILKQIPETSKDYNKAQRLKEDTQQRLIEIARERLLQEQREKAKTPPIKPVIQTRYLTEEEIRKKQKQLRSSATRLTVFSIASAGTGLIGTFVDPEKARGLFIASGIFGVLTSIETIVFVNKSARLTAGIAPGQIQFQIRF